MHVCVLRGKGWGEVDVGLKWLDEIFLSAVCQLWSHASKFLSVQIQWNPSESFQICLEDGKNKSEPK